MAIFVDPPQWPWRGRLWCHLISDISLDELHAFAREAGLRYLSFGFDHYDVPEDLFVHVQDLGAQVIDPREVVRKLRTSGLRTMKGKSAKRWKYSPEGLADVPVAGADNLAEAMARAVGPDVINVVNVEVLVRPSEVALVASGPKQPDELSPLREAAGAACTFLGASPGPWGWAIEAIWRTDT